MWQACLALSRAAVPLAPGRELASMTWAFATAGYADEQLFQGVAGALLRVGGQNGVGSSDRCAAGWWLGMHGWLPGSSDGRLAEVALYI